MKQEAVVMLHASASSGAQWRSLAAALAERYATFAPDLATRGPRPFTLEAEAGPIRALLERQGAPVHLVGHSYGGAVALHIARTSPQLVRKLVLIEPVAFHVLRDADAIDAQGLREFSDVAAAVRGAAPEAAAELFIDYWNGPGAWARTPPERRAPVLAALPKLALHFEAALGEPAGWREMRRVRAPVLLLQGGLTQLSTRCVADRLARALPVVAHRVVRGAGHMLPLTHREEVNRLVAAHLADPYAGAHFESYPRAA